MRLDLSALPSVQFEQPLALAALAAAPLVALLGLRRAHRAAGPLLLRLAVLGLLVAALAEPMLHPPRQATGAAARTGGPRHVVFAVDT